MEKPYYILAYYIFVPIESPEGEVARHKTFFEGKDVTARIYISREGINGQMCAAAMDAEHYMRWMREEERFKGIEFKIHTHHEHVFPRLTVKVRKQLVALDTSVDIEEGGESVTPKVWKRMLEERDEKTVLLDVRNDYEWKVGHFEGAELPTLEMFREFPEYVKKLKERCNPKDAKVMMYCTGGIRCELYSALLKREGFEKVYQLQGGVIGYGLEEGQKHWRGKLFVFDDRLSVPISEKEESEVISSCHYCETECDIYYNCANMDCNALFICCPTCAEEHEGCCSKDCRTAPRLRPYERGERPKPFRRWHLYENANTTF